MPCSDQSVFALFASSVRQVGLCRDGRRASENAHRCVSFGLLIIALALFVGAAKSDGHSMCDHAVELRQNQDLAGAVEAYNTCIQRQSLSLAELAYTLSLRGDLLRKLGRFEEAIADYDQAIAISPENAVFYNNRGNIWAEHGRVDLAFSDLGRALELDPENSVFLNNRGRLLQRDGKHIEAIADFDRAIILSPDFAMIYHNRAQSREALDEVELALEDYDRAIARSDVLGFPYTAKALLLFSTGEQHEIALQLIDKAIQIGPAHWYYDTIRGPILTVLGRPDEALASFERFMSEAPPEMVALYQVALADDGYKPGNEEGEWDDQSRDALMACIRSVCNAVTDTEPF